MAIIYGTRAEVQRILGVGTDSRFDEQIDEYLEKAGRYMDVELGKKTSVPMTTNDTLDDIASDIAAGMYREDKAGMRGEQVQRDTARGRGETALKAYIASNFADLTTDEDRFFVVLTND